MLRHLDKNGNNVYFSGKVDPAPEFVAVAEMMDVFGKVHG
jgi:hypothetical protein